ncbi:MAG: GAF domain-containing protein [Aggregatilineales bacterium]
MHSHLYPLVLRGIAQDNMRDADQRINALLQSVCELLNLEVGMISRIDPVSNCYIVAYTASREKSITAGTHYSLGITYCSLVLRRGDLVSITDMRVSPQFRHPCYEQIDVAVYIGVPLVINNIFFGIVNFTSAQPRERKFSPEERALVRTVTDFLGELVWSDYANFIRRNPMDTTAGV